jgi:hypothetical protein
LTNKHAHDDRKLNPGFSTNVGTRQLVINKLETYFRERVVVIRSIRTINELKTFIYENGKAQAAENYNDDLAMSLGIGLWVRDTALRLREQGIFLTQKMIDGIHVPQPDQTPIYTAKQQAVGQEQWRMKVGYGQGKTEDLTWLLR